MKRWVVRICVFLILGAIVNVAVAWGLTLTTSPRDIASGSRQQRGDIGSWAGERWECFGSLSYTSRWTRQDIDVDYRFGAKCEDVIPMWTSLGRRPTTWLLDSKAGSFDVNIIDARGWPMLALTAWTQIRHDGLTTARTIAGIPCSCLPSRSGLQMIGHTLPVRPIWPGFAINTVFYAGVLWVLFAMPFALRRRRRRRRGLCVKCGYDLRGGRGAGSTGGPDAITCPECGLVHKRSKT